LKNGEISCEQSSEGVNGELYKLASYQSRFDRPFWQGFCLDFKPQFSTIKELGKNLQGPEWVLYFVVQRVDLTLMVF